MELHPSTEDFLAQLDIFSGHTLSRRRDLGVLIELASDSGRSSVLDELSFQAKFISKCHGIMTRVGAGGEGYGRLLAEFSASLEKAGSLMRSILSDATPEANAHFTSTYLETTPESFQNLLMLMYDLSWYKNWHMDRSRGIA